MEIGATQIDFQVPVANLSFKSSVRYVKLLLGKSENRIKGEIVGGTRDFSIQLRTGYGKTTQVISTKTDQNMGNLIRSSAEQILLHCDPYLMAQFWFFKEQQSRTCTFTNALAAVKYALSRTDVSQHKRAYVAWGNILAAQRKFKEATTKYRCALELDPNFSTAYNSWGNLLRQQRRLGEAVEKYREAIRMEKCR